MDKWDDKDWGLLIRGSAGYLNSQEDVRRVAELIREHQGLGGEHIPPEMWMMGYCTALFNERLKGSNRYAGFITDERRVDCGDAEPTPERIMDLGLPRRVKNALRQSGITTLRELLEKSEEDLGWLRDIGKVALVQITQYLAKRGLTLRG